VLVLVAADLLALLAAGVAAFFIWAAPIRDQSAALYLQLTPLILLFIAGYAQAGLYPGFGVGPVDTLRRLTFVTTFGFLVLAAFSFALKLPHLYSRVTFVVTLGLSLIAVPLTRAAVAHLARGWAWWHEPVVVVGTGRRAARAIRGLARGGQIGYRATAVLSIDPPIHATVEDVPIVGGLEQSARLAAQGIRVALLEHDQLHDRALVDRLQHDFRHVVLLRAHDDLPVEGLQVRNLGDMVGIEYTNNLLVQHNRAIKRALEIAVSAVAMVFAAPIILVAASLVRALDRAPSFFTQDRSGLNGKRIAVPKVRTMRRDAEARLAEHLDENPELKTEWQKSFKLRDDPRLIPGIGRLFRRFSVDELPQLWSVLKGDMSLIGPRPFPDYHLKKFSPGFLELRQRVRPGITGLWQVTVRSEGGIEEQEAHDSYYIRNWSVWLDIYILSRTVAAVLSGRGAF